MSDDDALPRRDEADLPRLFPSDAALPVNLKERSSELPRWVFPAVALASVFLLGTWLYSTRSPVAEYVPLLLVFVSAVTGIAGKSWDHTKNGFARVTLKGRVLVLIAMLGLIVGVKNTRSSHARLAEVGAVREIADEQPIDGVSMMLYPITSSWREPPQSDAEKLQAAAAEPTVEALTETRLLPFADPVEDVMANIEAPRLYLVGVNGTRVVAHGGPPHRGFRALYELIDFFVDVGDAKVRETERTFLSILDPKTIMLLNNILDDEFYKSRYRNLSQHEDLFFQGLLDEAGDSVPSNADRSSLALLAVQRSLLPSGDETAKQEVGPSRSLYLGTYYFGPSAARDSTTYLAFIAKIGELVRHVSGILQSDHVIETY